MRIVVLTDDHPPMPGGVATFVGAVGAGLVGLGHEVSVFARARAGIAAVEGAELTPVRGRSFVKTAPLRLGWHSWSSRRGADLVIATTWRVVPWFDVPGAPLAVVAQGTEVSGLQTPPRAFRRAWRRADAAFAVSDHLAAHLSRLGVAAHTLPAPVDAASSPHTDPSGPWLFVGRAIATKGGDRFIRLVAAANRPGVLVGDGPALPAWKQLAAELGADVTFAGNQPRKDVRRLQREASLAFLLSRPDPRTGSEEALGFSLIEAAGQGTPCVGVAVGGIPQAVGPGLVLNDADDVDGSLQAICAWQTEDNGHKAWRWAASAHGTAKTVQHILDFVKMDKA